MNQKFRSFSVSSGCNNEATIMIDTFEVRHLKRETAGKFAIGIAHFDHCNGLYSKRKSEIFTFVYISFVKNITKIMTHSAQYKT